MQIREMRWEDEKDVDDAVRLLNTGKPWYPLTRDELREDGERHKGLLHRCFLLVGDTAGAVGFASIQESVWERSPGKLHIELAIDPQHRGLGLANLLHRRLMDEAAEYGAIGLVCYVDRTDPDWTAVAQHWGYVCTQTLCDVRLDPNRGVVDSLDDVALKAGAAGIRIASVEALADEFADAYQRLHALQAEIKADIPTTDPLPPVSFEQFMEVLQSPNRLGDAQFIALRGDRWIGASSLWKRGSDDVLCTGLTGVVRDERGKGIASLLKAHAVHYARRKGAPWIFADNAEENAAMRAINRRIGFEPLPGTAKMEKSLKA